MDPLSAISLASAIVQFVDFGLKIVRDTKDIYKSATGVTIENDNIEFTIGKLQTISGMLKQRTRGSPSESLDESLLSLAKRCETLSNELLELLKAVKAKSPDLKWASFIAAVRADLKKRERNEVLARLQECRQQLEVHISAHFQLLLILNYEQNRCAVVERPDC
jgi:hypothetical protein